MKKLIIKVDSELKYISGSRFGKRWSEQNDLKNIDTKIEISVEDNVEKIFSSFFQGILEYLVINDCEEKKYSISFENEEFQMKYQEEISF